MTDRARPTIMLLVSQLGHGGAERHMVTLANRLSARFDVVLAYVKDDATLLAQVDAGQLAEVLCLHSRSGFDRLAVKRLADAIDRHRPGIVLCANTYPMAYALAGKWLAAFKPRVVEVYHTTVLLHRKDRLQMLAYHPMMWALHRLVYVCHAQRGHWRRRGMRARRESVIHNGVDLRRFDPAPFDGTAADLRRRCGWTDDDFVVGLCAVMRPEKAHLDLLRAIRLADRSGRRWKALLIGDGPKRPQIEEEIRRSGLEGRVVITGYRTDVRPELAACDAVALVSVAVETFSIAALEAMAMAKPLIMSDIGGAREQVEPGQTGWLFPPGDVESLARCLEAAGDRPQLRAMGRRARDRVVRDYSMETMIERYTALIEADMPPSAQGLPIRNEG
jgi:glycosyltransferase involved in cell wall biosynthesis